MISRKRYCKTLQLKNDPNLIDEYKQLHARGNVWPEITEGLKKVGVLDMEIYISGTTLFMIMDTVDGFDHDAAMTQLGTLTRQGEWEALVSRFQKTMPGSSAKEKWQLVERIFKLDQENEESPENGYLEKISD